MDERQIPTPVDGPSPFDAAVSRVEDCAAPAATGSPCTVTLFGAAFDWDGAAPRRLTLSVTVDNGDAAGIIDYFRKAGRAYFPDDKGVSWFMPWPPAAIRIVRDR